MPVAYYVDTSEASRVKLLPTVDASKASHIKLAAIVAHLLISVQIEQWACEADYDIVNYRK